MRIFLIAGHGGTDPGAIANGFTEHELNKSIVEEATPILQKHGIEVITPNYSTTLNQKIQYVNSFSAYKTPSDLLISCHINAAGSNEASGIEAWHYSNSTSSKKLGETLLKNIQNETNMRNRGSKDEQTNRYGRLGIVHYTYPLAVLMEFGFITNKNDIEILKNPQNREPLIKGLVKGILEYINIPYKEETDEILKTEDFKNLQKLTNEMREIRLSQKDSLKNLNTLDKDADTIRSQQNSILEEKHEILKIDLQKLIELSDGMHYVRVGQKEALSDLNLLDEKADIVRSQYIRILDKYRSE